MSDNTPAGDGAQGAAAEGDNTAQNAAAPQAPQPQAPQQPAGQAPAPQGAPQAPPVSAPQPPVAPAAPQMQAPGFMGGPQAPGAPQAPAGYPYAPAPRASKGLAITALILGLVGVVGGLIFGWLPFVGGIITVLVGAAALILGIIAMSKRQSKGMALTGLITGGVAVLMGIGFIIFWSVLFSQAQTSLDDYSSSLEDLQSEFENYDSDEQSSSPFESDSSDASTDPADYSPAFCAALEGFLTVGEQGVNSDDPAIRSALERVAAEDSPNRAVYQDFLDLTANASASESEVALASIDLMTATAEDATACL